MMNDQYGQKNTRMNAHVTECCQTLFTGCAEEDVNFQINQLNWGCNSQKDGWTQQTLNIQWDIIVILVNVC